MTQEGKLGELIDVRDRPHLQDRSTHTDAEIRRIARVTGRDYVGSTQTSEGHLLPVFSKEEHDDNEHA